MKPEPICKPLVNAQLDRMNTLQRATESFRYILLSIEWWMAPTGTIRAWLKQNVRVGAWLLIPTVLVMPIVTLILWLLTGWVTMIAGKLVLILLLLIGARIFMAFFKR